MSFKKGLDIGYFWLTQRIPNPYAGYVNVPYGKEFSNSVIDE
jgi:hypothetical protein